MIVDKSISYQRKMCVLVQEYPDIQNFKLLWILSVTPNCSGKNLETWEESKRNTKICFMCTQPLSSNF